MSAFSYVSIEGVDGVGKTLLTKRLQSYFCTVGVQVNTKNEFPAAPAISEPILDALSRSPFISEGFVGGPHAALFYMLYAESAALSEAMSTGSEANLLIADRAVDSICVYQGGSIVKTDGLHVVDLLEALEKVYVCLGMRLPDCTVLLRLPRQEIGRRYEARHRRPPSLHELDRLMWLQEQYDAIACVRDRFVVVSGDNDPEAVLNDAIAAIRSKIRLDSKI